MEKFFYLGISAILGGFSGTLFNVFMERKITGYQLFWYFMFFFIIVVIMGVIFDLFIEGIKSRSMNKIRKEYLMILFIIFLILGIIIGFCFANVINPLL